MRFGLLLGLLFVATTLAALSKNITVVIIAALIAALLWWYWDQKNSLKFDLWLHDPLNQTPPELDEFWGGFILRIHKCIIGLTHESQAHQQKLEEFLTALRYSPYGIVLLDALGRIEWANETAGHFHSIHPERDKGQYIRNLIRNHEFVTYLDNGVFDKEIHIKGPQLPHNSTRELSIRIHPYGAQKNLIITRDITEFMLTESIRRDFVANVSHELRTPLMAMSACMESLQTLPLSDTEHTHLIMQAEKQTKRMHMLVEDLLELTQLENSPPIGQGSWIAAQELLQHVLLEAQLLSKSIASPEHRIEGNTLEKLEVSGIKSELLSAMGNLLSNAVRYSPAGEIISCGWHRAPGTAFAAQFWVTDHGPGIATEHLPRLTERFYRIDQSRAYNSGGTGLGLAIVKHVVQRHNAKLNIQSQIGHGATFTITFPTNRSRLQPHEPSK